MAEIVVEDEASQTNGSRRFGCRHQRGDGGKLISKVIRHQKHRVAEVLCFTSPGYPFVFRFCLVDNYAETK